MNTEKEILRRKTERHYMLVVFLNGVKNIQHDRRKRIIFFSAALAVLLLTVWLCQLHSMRPAHLVATAIVGYSAAALAVLAVVIYCLGVCPMPAKFMRIFCVSAGSTARENRPS